VPFAHAAEAGDRDGDFGCLFVGHFDGLVGVMGWTLESGN